MKRVLAVFDLEMPSGRLTSLTQTFTQIKWSSCTNIGVRQSDKHKGRLFYQYSCIFMTHSILGRIWYGIEWTEFTQRAVTLVVDWIPMLAVHVILLRGLDRTRTGSKLRNRGLCLCPRLLQHLIYFIICLQNGPSTAPSSLGSLFYNSTDHVAKVHATMMEADCLYDEQNVGKYCGGTRGRTKACRVPEVNLSTSYRMFSWNVVRVGVARAMARTPNLNMYKMKNSFLPTNLNNSF